MLCLACRGLETVVFFLIIITPRKMRESIINNALMSVLSITIETDFRMCNASIIFM